jgi:hypothetical protein
MSTRKHWRGHPRRPRAPGSNAGAPTPHGTIRKVYEYVEQRQRLLNRKQRAAPVQASEVWAFLHGAVALEAAQVLGEIKPASGLEFGFEAWSMAVSMRGEPIDALRIKPTQKRANKKVSARGRSLRSGK